MLSTTSSSCSDVSCSPLPGLFAPCVSQRSSSRVQTGSQIQSNVISPVKHLPACLTNSTIRLNSQSQLSLLTLIINKICAAFVCTSFGLRAILPESPSPRSRRAGDSVVGTVPVAYPLQSGFDLAVWHAVHINYSRYLLRFCAMLTVYCDHGIDIMTFRINAETDR
jgi:hypothetical protein